MSLPPQLRMCFGQKWPQQSFSLEALHCLSPLYQGGRVPKLKKELFNYISLKFSCLTFFPQESGSFIGSLTLWHIIVQCIYISISCLSHGIVLSFILKGILLWIISVMMLVLTCERTLQFIKELLYLCYCFLPFGERTNHHHSFPSREIQDHWKTLGDVLFDSSVPEIPKRKKNASIT